MSGTSHSGHDYSLLCDRWKTLANEKGWKCSEFFQAEEFPVLMIENERAAAGEEDGIYLSAGVHGDECAPPWALLEWAESGAKALLERAVLFFPCLNPAGLELNTRIDGAGVDLNRNFQNPEIPLIEAWQKLLEGRRFATALNLHEDYDAGGIYLYELARSASRGENFLSACESIIPRESADSVDGSDFENGLLRRDVDEEELQRVIEEDLEGGWPEAIWLYLHHAKDSFTFETPSELDLATRVATHRTFLEVAAGS